MSVSSQWQVLVSLCTDKTVKLLSLVVNITVYFGGMFWCKLRLKLWRKWLSIVSYTLVYVEDWLQETGQDSHLRFDCLYCNLLTDHVIARNVNIGKSPQSPPAYTSWRSGLLGHKFSFSRSLTPLPLLLLSGCWPPPIPCPSIVRQCNIVLCSSYIYTCQFMVQAMHLWAISVN